MLRLAANANDSLEHFWEHQVMKRAAGGILVFVYLFTIIAVEINRRFALPDPFDELIPFSHFFAVEIAFTILLFTEVVSLIFGLARSFSRSIGIQLEILTLIFLRDTFKQFTTLGEPIIWEEAEDVIQPMLVDAFGALILFVIIGIYYRVLRERPITDNEVEQAEFIAYKKLIALGLICVFVFIGVYDLYQLLTGGETYPFFETFYTVLIFTDVLMVLLSLSYGISFSITFRNFGYAAVTVFIRMALIAPTLIAVLLGIGAALFALGLTLAYNRSITEIKKLADHNNDADAESTESLQNPKMSKANPYWRK